MVPDLAPRDGEGQPRGALRREGHGFGHVAQSHARVGEDLQGHLARRSFGMNEFQQQAACVTGGEEARQGGGDDHRIACDDLGTGVAHGRFGPGHRHQADGAVEGRLGDLDLGPPVRADGDGSGEPCHQLFGRGRRLQLRPGCRVAAGPDAAHGPVHPVDEPPVDVAQLHPQPPLAEVVVRHVRCLESGQVQDAHVHRRERDIGGLALGDALHGDGGAEGTRLPVHHLRRIEANGQLPLSRQHLGVDQPQLAGGVEAGGHVHPVQDGGGDIGAAAPIGPDRQRQQVLARRHRQDLPRHHPVRQYGDQRHAVALGDQPQAGRLAHPVAFAVERHFQPVGRIGASVAAVPARGKGDRGGRVGRADPLHHDLVAAPFGRCRHGDRLRAQRHLAGGYTAAPGHRLPLPVAVELIPLILPVDPVHGPARLHRRAGALGRNGDQVKGGLRSLGQHILEPRSDSDQRCLWQDGTGLAPLHRSAGPF